MITEKRNLPPERLPTGPEKLGKQGHLFIISAPSGAGKTTLCKIIMERFPDIQYSVSSTTREPRPGEENGKDYFFLSEVDFIGAIKQNRWAEWAKVHDHYYGTSADFIRMQLSSGKDILLDIDVQGMLQILSQFPQSITIFIMPPSLDALESRMKSRKTDSAAVIAKRLENAESEMKQKDRYHHIIVNDDLQTAIAELIQIIQSYRSRDDQPENKGSNG